LVKRIGEHKNNMVEGFTKKYYVDKLVYYEVYESIESAILREKQIKSVKKTRGTSKNNFLF
jgi:putative endonuclease